VPAGRFYDRVDEFIGEHMQPGQEQAGAVLAWEQRNRHELKAFWALEKDAALKIKKRLEEVAAFEPKA